MGIIDFINWAKTRNVFNFIIIIPIHTKLGQEVRFLDIFAFQKKIPPGPPVTPRWPVPVPADPDTHLTETPRVSLGPPKMKWDLFGDKLQWLEQLRKQTRSW